MFGALLTAVAAAMARLPDVHLDRLPRMADFALWAAAAEPALGIEHGAFVATYAGNRESAVSMVLDDSLVAVAVRQYMADKSTWEGTAAVLLGELSGLVSEADQRSKRWVRSPRGLAGQLRRLAPALRMVGIDVSFERQGRGNDQRRTVRIEARGNCGNG
jgi:hypothetical protein